MPDSTIKRINLLLIAITAMSILFAIKIDRTYDQIFKTFASLHNKQMQQTEKVMSQYKELMEVANQSSEITKEMQTQAEEALKRLDKTMNAAVVQKDFILENATLINAFLRSEEGMKYQSSDKGNKTLIKYRKSIKEYQEKMDQIL